MNVIDFLAKRGYKVSPKPYEIIGACNSWYRDEPIEGFHNRQTVQGASYKLESTGLAKRCCEDDANLLEILQIKTERDATAKIINDILGRNRFIPKLREQLEGIAAAGTAGAYIRVENANLTQTGKVIGGELVINYAVAQNIFPLVVKNGEIVDCAFAGKEIINGKMRHVIVLFTSSDGIYKAETVWFNEYGSQLEAQVAEYPKGVKPFWILKTAGVNNISGMDGFGVPKIWKAITYLKGVDLAWNVFIRDMEKADKLVLMNERLFKFDDETGEPIPPNAAAKQLFCILGEKLPSEDSLYHEYNPSIRIEELTKAMELCLSMLSMQFGYGTRKYSFEQGNFRTATEYIGERQDMMQELNRQRSCVESYVKGLCSTILAMVNYLGLAHVDPHEPISLDFDDSYINDREQELSSIRDDIAVLGLPKLTERYLMEKYGLSAEEANSWIMGTPEDNEDRDVE